MSYFVVLEWTEPSRKGGDVSASDEIQQGHPQKELLAGCWHDYGGKFSVTVPNEQPSLTVREPELPDIDMRSPQ